MLIIAEFGSSPAAQHWPLDRWCEGARAASADAVKVQLFQAGHFPEGEQDSKRALEFPRGYIHDFAIIAHAHGLSAGASVFDTQAADLAARYCDFMKLAAREQVNSDLTDYAVELATRRNIPLYRSISNTKYFVQSPSTVTLFTIQSYPAGISRSLVALFRAAVFFNARGAKWGWSSHTRGDLDCVIAKRMGASVLEKHFALGKTDLEAGHSLLPHEFSRMVEKCQ